MINFLKLLNDNHWYLIAFALVCGLLFWIYGCQSEVYSLINPEQKVNRAGLQVEVNYLLGRARVKFEDLDSQDEIKRLLLEQAAIFATTGTFNPMGLLNTVITIVAVAFGLDRNKKLKDARAVRNNG